LLAHAILVPAHVGRDERVTQQRLAHVGENPLGPHRIRIARRVRLLPAMNRARAPAISLGELGPLDACRYELARDARFSTGAPA
jgi:hypothetical protein